MGGQLLVCRHLLFGSFLPQLTAPGESLKGTAVLAVSLVMFMAFWKSGDQCHYSIGTTCILSLPHRESGEKYSKAVC